MASLPHQLMEFIFLNLQAWSQLGSNFADIYFYMNGSQKSRAYRDGEYDTVTLSSQFKLNKGDTVWVYMNGYFSIPTYRDRTFFEGHLIRQINS